MLTGRIFAGYQDAVAEAAEHPGVTELAAGRPGAGPWGATPRVFQVTLKEFAADIAVLSRERFGPAGLVITYPSVEDLLPVLGALAGNLAATVHLDAGSAEDLELARQVIAVLERVAGRVVCNGWPTGVAVVAAQHHGGPWPATTVPAYTSVGTAAIRRWLVPVAYQDFPPELLPPACGPPAVTASQASDRVNRRGTELRVAASSPPRVLAGSLIGAGDLGGWVPMSTDPASTEPRDDLPGVERLLTLTDGVVAIAITLLVLQLNVPNPAQLAHPDSASELAKALGNGADQLISYVISFYVIAQFWLVHHRVFRRIAGQREGLAWWNFAFLFTITVMPFTSDLLGKYAGNPLAIDIFAVNLLAATVATQLTVVFVRRNNLLVAGTDAREMQTAQLRVAAAVFVIVLSIGIAWVNTDVAKYCWLLLGVAPAAADRWSASRTRDVRWSPLQRGAVSPQIAVNTAVSRDELTDSRSPQAPCDRDHGPGRRAAAGVAGHLWRRRRGQDRDRDLPGARQDPQRPA